MQCNAIQLHSLPQQKTLCHVSLLFTTFSSQPRFDKKILHFKIFGTCSKSYALPCKCTDKHGTLFWQLEYSPAKLGWEKNRKVNETPITRSCTRGLMNSIVQYCHCAVQRVWWIPLLRIAILAPLPPFLGMELFASLTFTARFIFSRLPRPV